ncbi:MAG: HAD-IC family P-type ATPase, partial [Phycisphaerales bacterium]|nr:HAD-IC family P-type ATPase [Phycisphaerales bacterium]
AVSVDRIEAECLPEEKHTLVKKMVADGRRVLMVGDGINDGPSLASADVGVAMGLAGSDIATNSAGIALMNDDISRVPFLMMLARRSRNVIMQNIAASIIIALIGLILAATGRFGIFGAGGAFIAAALYHFIAEGFVLFNSMRLLRFGEEFASEEHFASGTAPAGAVRPTPTPAAAG